MRLDVWVSCAGSPYQMLTIKNKSTVNHLTNAIGTYFGIPPGLLRLYHGHCLLSESRALEIGKGSFIQAELGLHGGGTGQRASTDNSPTGEPDKSEQDQLPVLNKMNRVSREEDDKQNDPSTKCTLVSRTIPLTRARETNSSRIESGCLTSEKAADQFRKDQVERWVDVENRPIDFARSHLPPQLLTLTDAQIKNQNQGFDELVMNPKGTNQLNTPDRKLKQPPQTKRHLSPYTRPMDGNCVEWTTTMKESKQKKMKLECTTHGIDGYGATSPKLGEINKPGLTWTAQKRPKNTTRTLAFGNHQTESTRGNEHEPTANTAAKTQPLLDNAHATTTQIEQTKHISSLWNKWSAFANFAAKLRVFQQPRAVLQGTIRKLSRTSASDSINNHQLTTMCATTICIATMGEGHILDTICTGQEWKFEKYCQAISPKNKVNSEELDDAISQFWNLLSTILKPILKLTKEKLPKTPNAVLI